MKIGTLRLGLECNHKCLFCTISDDNDPTLNTTEAKKKIDVLVSQNVEIINFTGGEPTIRNDLVELFKYAKSKGIKRIELQTNGILLANKNYLNNLINNGLFSITMSFHSHIKNIYEEITESKDFEKALNALENIFETNLNIVISHVLTTQNFSELLNFLKFFKQFKRNPRIYLSLVRPNGRTKENKKIVPKLTDIFSTLKEAFKYLKNEQIWYEVEGIPLCYMDGNNNKSAETRRITKQGNYDESQIYISKKDDGYKLHEKTIKQLKVKSEVCKKCSLNNICVGIWKEYAELYGFDELKSINNNNNNNNIINIDNKNITQNNNTIMTDVGVSIRCNNSCIMCTNIMPPYQKQKEPSYKYIINKIDEIAKYNNNIIITGGEPTIRKDILDILHYINKKYPNQHIKLISNARVFSYDSFVKKIRKIKNFEIITELYGSNEFINDSITRVKGSFKQSFLGIKKLLDVKIPVELRMVISKANYKDLPSLGRLYSKYYKNAKRVVLFPIDIIGNAYINKDKTIVKITEIIPFITKTIDLLEFKDIRLFHTPFCVIQDKYRKYIQGVTVLENRITFDIVCDECKYYNLCPRIWKTYSKIIGTEEFHAIKN